MTDHERAASPARETALSRSPQARPSTGSGEPEANDSRAASFTPPLAGRAAPSRARAGRLASAIPKEHTAQKFFRAAAAGRRTEARGGPAKREAAPRRR